MYELCKKKDLIHPQKLTLISNHIAPLDKLPNADSEQVLICAYDQWGIEEGANAKLIVCESKDDMQKLYTSYSNGLALNISWYLAPKPEYIYNTHDQSKRLVSLTPLKVLMTEDPDTASAVIGFMTQKTTVSPSLKS